MGRAGRVQLPCSTTAISEHKTGKDLQDHQFRQGLSSQCLTLHILKTSGNQKNLGGWQSSLNTHRRKVSPPQPSANAGTDGSRLPAGAAPLPLAPDPACARGAKPGIASPPPAPRPWRLPVEPLEPSGRGKWRAGPGPARSGPEEAGPGTSPPPWAPRDGRDQELWPTAGTGGFSRPAGCEGRPGAGASPPRRRWGTGRISFPRLPGSEGRAGPGASPPPGLLSVRGGWGGLGLGFSLAIANQPLIFVQMPMSSCLRRS